MTLKNRNERPSQEKLPGLVDHHSTIGVRPAVLPDTVTLIRGPRTRVKIAPVTSTAQRSLHVRQMAKGSEKEITDYLEKLKSFDLYLFGKRPIAIRQNAAMNFDVIAYSTITKKFSREPKLYTAMQWDQDDLVYQLTALDFIIWIQTKYSASMEDFFKCVDESE
jgi:hypothetical protein